MHDENATPGRRHRRIYLPDASERALAVRAPDAPAGMCPLLTPSPNNPALRAAAASVLPVGTQALRGHRGAPSHGLEGEGWALTQASEPRLSPAATRQRHR